MKTQRKVFERKELTAPFQAEITKLKSPTYGELTLEEVADKIADYMDSHDYGDKYTIAIGTDSQNFQSTKVVAAVCLYCKGHGGIYFYSTFRFPKMQIHDKILNETVMSVNLATTLSPLLEKSGVLEKVNLQIHCDIGKQGKTSSYIREITGMVKACNYTCVIKPDSFAASGIANKYSK